MSLMGFLILLVVAAFSGAIAQALAGFSRGGCLVSILVGFVGAYVGMWLAGQFNLPEFFIINIDGRPFPLVWSIIGGALFAAVLGLIFGRGRRYRHT